MSSEARRRLATVAADAGYPGALLAEIAVATLPAYTTVRSWETSSWGRSQTPLSCSPRWG